MREAAPWRNWPGCPETWVPSQLVLPPTVHGACVAPSASHPAGSALLSFRWRWASTWLWGPPGGGDGSRRTTKELQGQTWPCLTVRDPGQQQLPTLPARSLGYFRPGIPGSAISGGLWARPPPSPLPCLMGFARERGERLGLGCRRLPIALPTEEVGTQPQWWGEGLSSGDGGGCNIPPSGQGL